MKLLLPIFLLPAVLGYGDRCGGVPEKISQNEIDDFSKEVIRVEYVAHTESATKEGETIRCGPESEASKYAWLVSVMGSTPVLQTFGNELVCKPQYGEWYCKGKECINGHPMSTRYIDQWKMSCVRLVNDNIEQLESKGFSKLTVVRFNSNRVIIQPHTFQFQFSPNRDFYCPQNFDIRVTTRIGSTPGANNFTAHYLKNVNGEIFSDNNEKLKMVSEGDDPQWIVCKPRNRTVQAPIRIHPSEFPAPWIPGEELLIVPDGQNNWAGCEHGYIGKLSYGSKTFSFQGIFMWDRTKWSNKWIKMNSTYEAPPFVSCGKVSSGVPASCEILHIVNKNGGFGSIALYPGHEEICANGQTLQYADGPQIKSLRCKAESGEIEITENNGSISTYKNPYLQCA